MPDAQTLTLQVAQARMLSPQIRLLRLQKPDGAALPGWQPGAHIQVRVALGDGAQDWRHYSLIDLEGQPEKLQAPTSYTIAVRLEEAGRGGSRFMHTGLQEGQSIDVQLPKKRLPLQPAPWRFSFNRKTASSPAKHSTSVAAAA